MPQTTPRSLQPAALQRDAIRVHGKPIPDMGGRRQTKSDKVPEKSSFQLGNAQTPPEVPIKEGEPASQDSQIAQYEKAISALPGGSTLRDNLKTQMLALNVTLPPETRPGVRVDQATARLA